VKRSWISYPRLFRYGIFVAVLLLGLGIDMLGDQRTTIPYAGPIIIVLVLIVAGIGYWLADQWFSIASTQKAQQERIQSAESHLGDLQKRITTVIKVNNQLAEITDERALMQAVLEQIAELTGADGSSYVPLDELGQPLAVIHQGSVPQAVFTRWMNHLSDPEIQEVCRECKLRKSSLVTSCPLQDHELFDNAELHCLSVKRGERILGMLNLYFSRGHTLPDELSSFVDGLLAEIALAVETFRLRDQEVATLRELQLIRSPRMDLPTLLKGMLEDVQQALEADYAILCSNNHDPNGRLITLGRSGSAILDVPEIHTILQTASQGRDVVSHSAASAALDLPDGIGSIIAAPLTVPETSNVLGAIAVGNVSTHPFYPRQVKVLRTVAEQAALLIERDRLIDDLEYHTIIDERTRLAREIHDGLAQTLAFLKLQSSQMQSSLAKGDMDRLKDLLQTSYKTLSDAYLDTRQAIDNLRVTPRETVEDWLSQTVKDFMKATGINTQLVIQPGSIDLPNEIQAQLIRVVQEALSNIRKHASAGNVIVSMRRWKEDIILEVTDDGQGFSPEDVPILSQYGLRGMRERAEIIGADFQITSSTEQGTIVRLRLPYRIEETPV
jgi:two-component system, NarL family, nitrate/nitrite sensor histidine kinase NarX